MEREIEATTAQQIVTSTSELEGELETHDTGPREDITLPVPSELVLNEQALPPEVVDALRFLRTHRAKKLSELAEYVSAAIPSVNADEGLVTLVGYEERIYDEYFGVERTVNLPLFHVALAFLKTVRDFAANARLGEQLEPAALADLLRSIRNDAEVILEVAKS
ncbi:MAG: hypothetical protein JO261_07670 [Alphaproteobacteria bacterium]|nr:hypothetical protein [Alphaproteobacteria bacterium]MBV9693561.1 hypothetical protein [Alphaproteobacteria bacterium]